MKFSHKISLIMFTLLNLLSALDIAQANVAGKDLFTENQLNITPGQKGTVVIFMSAKCPCSESHVKMIKKMASDYSDFTFVAVHSNADEDLDFTKNYFKKTALPFSVIDDDLGSLANKFKALKTPHAFLLNPEGKILYNGGVSNSTNGESADKLFLRDALSDVVANKPVKKNEGRTLGCVILRGENYDR